jgi:hypothetical protein
MDDTDDTILNQGYFLGVWWGAAHAERYWGRLTLLKMAVEAFSETDPVPGNMIKRARANFQHRHRDLGHFPLSKECFMCGTCSVTLVRHHIVPIKHHGGNRRYNICTLCWDCHAEVHPWLKGIPAPRVVR